MTSKSLALATCLAAVALCSFARAEDPASAAPTVALKIAEPREPIARNANGADRATRVQAFDLAANSGFEQVLLTISEPKFIKRFEARIGAEVVASFDANGIFDVDWNRPTNPTQIPLIVDAPETVAKGGELTIWAFPTPTAPLDAKIEIGVKSATFNGADVAFDAAPLEYRFGVLVRDSGWDGVAQYRIPGIAQTTKGTLIAVYDARWNGFPDLPANIDVMCSRSFDGGETWAPMQVVMDFKGENEAAEGVGDPSILVDPETGRIWVAALWAHNAKSTEASQPGLKFGTSGRFMLCYSDDDGATWSEPRDVTNEAAPDAEWRIFFQGPGNGIALRDGKLVFPAQFIDKDGVWFSTLLWSADKGKSWHAGTGARKMTCECQAVELNDGAVMLNMRNFSGAARSVATTNDLGATWTEHSTSCKALVEPICQASLIRVKSTRDGDDANLLAFMNPNHPKHRVDMTIKLSEDEGQTWSRSLTLYRPGGCGYSCLVKLDAETLGAFYETSGGLLFQRVKLADVQ